MDLLFVRTEAMFVNVGPNWRAVEALAEALLRDKTIAGRRARKIILEVLRSSPVALTGTGQGQALRVALHAPIDPSSGSNW